jgi:hypothetical protein
VAGTSARKSAAVNDVPADDPVGTMDRFADGLKEFLNAPKQKALKGKRR